MTMLVSLLLKTVLQLEFETGDGVGPGKESVGHWFPYHGRRMSVTEFRSVFDIFI